MTDEGPQRPVSRIRGRANMVALIAAILFAIGFALGPGFVEPRLIAYVGVAGVFAFVVSFVAIMIENRQQGGDEHDR